MRRKGKQAMMMAMMMYSLSYLDHFLNISEPFTERARCHVAVPCRVSSYVVCRGHIALSAHIIEKEQREHKF
jgi:hypothetical protein